MGLRKTAPIHFMARGVADTLDQTNGSPGSMKSLQNLVVDPSTAGMFTCRPASILGTNFGTGGFVTPTAVSVFMIVGTRIYGMLTSLTYPGKDEPFCFDIPSLTFIPVTGTTVFNLPASQQISGAWIPPTMDNVGSKILLTHPGFGGALTSYYVGIIDASNPAAPVWQAGNLTGYPLVAVPIAVAQFNNRAYWLVNPVGSPSGVYASDVLAPTVNTNNYVLNFDDLTPCTAMAGLPMNNQSGGIIQSLMVFKGASNVYQIQGDPALSTWSRNTLNVNTGTLSPRSIAITPQGLMFIAPDGPRLISFTGNVSDVIGVQGEGVVTPFINSLDPTRICASANASIYRVSVKPVNQNKWVEYWFEFSHQQWTGPHTCPASDICNYNNTFIATPVAQPASLYQSDYVPTPTSKYTEYGVALAWVWQTNILPDTQQMAENAMVETTIHMGVRGNNGATPVVQVQALDDFGVSLGSCSVYSTGPLWGDGITRWGDGTLWGGKTGLTPRPLNWSTPLVFRRLALQSVGASNGSLKIGDLYLRYQQLGYLQQ